MLLWLGSGTETRSGHDKNRMDGLKLLREEAARKRKQAEELKVGGPTVSRERAGKGTTNILVMYSRREARSM